MAIWQQLKKKLGLERWARRRTLPPGVKLLRTLDGHSGTILGVAFDPQGKTLASTSSYKWVKLWDAGSGMLIRSLGGHEGAVNSVAFNPQGRALASGSSDNTVKLWDVVTGTLLRSLKGHKNDVNCVAFDPQGHALASASSDNTVKLWDAGSGKLLRTHEGHNHAVSCVAFDSKGQLLASGGVDETVKLWDVSSGNLLRTLEGHKERVNSVAFDPQSQALASGSADGTVKHWTLNSGKLIRTLEGHTGDVESVAFSANGRLLASKSRDQTIRLWNCDTWETVAVIPQPSYPKSKPVLAFHPTLPVLATDGSPRDLPEFGNSRLIHLWELNCEVLLGRSSKRGAHHTTAKVVLVGDTGVGKSGMAERLIYNRFVKTDSTHARRALMLESKQVAGDGGTVMHRDTVLWDLAGQPAYRLVHQLSMDDAAVACVLFDARSETKPFEGAGYWSEVLKQAKTNAKLTSLLVAARTDVGGLPASIERIKAFAAEHGFGGVFQTSAKTGEGCPELLAAIKQAIPWDDLPAVSSTEELANLRDFVARLKGVKQSSVKESSHHAPRDESSSRRSVRTTINGEPPELMTIAELKRRFTDDTGHDLPQDHFVAYLKRLEDCDEIDLLVFDSTGESPDSDDMVLLDPTRVDAYASALLVAAKDEPDGPGHLLESRVRDGDFKLEASERLADKDFEKHVLWYVMESLFQRELALREPIDGEDYAVFPAQCRTAMKFPGAATFGVAFGMAGPVRGIYATLIAQLAHYEGFAKREFFEDAAAYHTADGLRCLVRLHDNGDGTGEMEVSFDHKLPYGVRQGFLEFVERHVESKSVPGSFTKRHAHHCSQCGRLFDDAVVKTRLKDKLDDLLCPFCEQRTPLVNLLVPSTPESAGVVERMTTNARAGRRRITAGWVIKGKEAQGKYDVFLSHNSQDKDAVEEIARKLKSVGLRPWLDKWDLAPGDSIRKSLEWAIKNIPCAALFFGPADVGKWHIMEIDAYIERWAGGDARMIPVILPDAPAEPEIPIFVRQTLWVNMRDWTDEGDDGFYRLVCGILGKSPGDSPRTKFGARDVWDWQD